MFIIFISSLVEFFLTLMEPESFLKICNWEYTVLYSKSNYKYLLNMNIKCYTWDFTLGPVVKTPCFRCKGAQV